jgi:hypothetical protein
MKGDHGMLDNARDARSDDPVTRYSVEIDSLTDFAAFLDREMRLNVDPATSEVRADAPHGMNWGATLNSALVENARFSYLEAHEISVRNLARYIGAGSLMTEVIERLMQMYRTTEEMARLTTEDVLGVFATVRAERELDDRLRAGELDPGPWLFIR